MMIKCHMTDRAQEIWHGKRKYDWIHLNISQDIPPITGGSYKYQVWDLLKERADKDILICKYVPESFDIANKSECAVCQFDIYSVDIKTAITCRVNWLKRLLFRKANNVFLESVAEWIRATGGKRIMIWGGINSLPELRRLLPEITIVYTQRHYRYAQRFNYYNYCDTLITQTHGQAKDAFTNSIRLDPFVVTIPNGVETDSFSPYSQDKKCEIRKTFGIVPESFVVVFPSKVALYKGSRYLERLIEISKDYFPEVLFLVIGGLHNLKPLSHQNKLKNLLKNHSQVHWCEGVPREDMPPLLSIGDVCLMPATLREGFSMAGIESMASGLPLIATASGCYPEIIKDRFNGLLCGEEALFDNLVNALQVCLADRDLVRVMGRNARRYVEEKLPREKNMANYCKFLDGAWEGIDSDMTV